MNVAKRTKKLKAKLLDIRLGPGAAILSNDIQRIHLDFAYKIEDGHRGARKLWRNYLPRLKYHNPAIPMTVNRHRDQASPAILTILFAPNSKSASPTAPLDHSHSNDASQAHSKTSTGERVETIDMKHKHESEILELIMTLTKGHEYEASAEELADLEDVADTRRRSETDRQAQSNLNERRKQERSLLEQARGKI